MASKISDEAVLKSTGKIWKEWFVILNKAGAKNMTHKEIARWLKKNYIISGWWLQMVTVQYEKDVKGRKKHEKPDGYQISKSKTFSHSVSRVFSAINSLTNRNQWLKNPDFKITTVNKNKSIRGKSIDGKTLIEFQFYPKDKNKTQLVVQQSKLPSAKEAEKMKKYWSKNLSNLKSFLEE